MATDVFDNLPRDWLKFETMSPLAERVYDLGVCAQCHTKTMRFIHEGAGMRFLQCTGCKLVAVRPPDSHHSATSE